MKHFYLAISVTQENKQYALGMEVSENDNLISKLDGVPGIRVAQLCPTKKRMIEVMNFWNDSYRANGTSLY